MRKIQNRTFHNTTVVLDDNEYDQCTFDHCQFVYRGTGEVKFTECSFSEFTMKFEGGAARTLDFLQVMNHLHPAFRSIITQVINNISVQSPSGKGEISH